MVRALAIASLLAACGSQEGQVRPTAPGPSAIMLPRLPSTPGEHSPSLVAIDRSSAMAGEVSDGAMLSDVDSCASCHPDAAAQWGTSPHSFASFGNPIYRVNVELTRSELGRKASNHCGGCHDMPLMVDGLMAGDVPATDLRSHSGVTCRLCHGIKSVSKDGNGSYAWSRAPLDAPTIGDAASIEKHRAQVTVKPLGTELCVGCHRGFLSPDMGDGMPVHLSGLDEPGAWRNSAWTGNGMARIDKVEQKTCIDCHMEREPASAAELGAKAGTVASHRFLGGHTWMASMRGDADHLKRLRAKLEGVASIDVAGAFFTDAHGSKQWHLPADGAALSAATKRVAPTMERARVGPNMERASERWRVGPNMERASERWRVGLDVVVRNLLVGHRFPGGVLDIQDTWIEVEVADRAGKRIAASGLTHETDVNDEDTHVLRTLVVDDHGNVLEHHEMPRFRTQIATQTLGPREAQAIRYELAVPAGVAQPLTVTARLRHRSRTLAMQAEVCREAKTKLGREFIAGARGARDVTLDPCKPQPVTLIAETKIQLGTGAKLTTTRPAWERMYEHGMALTATVSERLEESRTILDRALAAVPADNGRGRAMVLVQLAQVAAKQGRADDALALVAQARGLMPVPGPAVFDTIEADALARVWRWDEAVAPAEAAAKKAKGNSQAWVMAARCYGSINNNEAALAAAAIGLELTPRDPDLLRSQATALAALKRPEAPAALAAFDRFRSPDNSADLRISCAAGSDRCAREREQGHTHQLHPTK